MKKFLFSSVLLLASIPLVAQYAYTVEKVTDSSVPASVKDSFTKRFSDASVVRWEKHTGKGAKRSVSKFVVIFDQDGIRSRARYRPDGSGISASSYYLFKRLEKLPDAVKAYAADNYPDHKLGSGEKILSLKSSVYAYRIRLRKGSSVAVVYLNEEGEKLNKDNLSVELIEDEGN